MKAIHIAAERKNAGVRQQDIAVELGCNRETVVDIERGRIGIDDLTESEIKAAIQKVAARREEVTAA